MKFRYALGLAFVLAALRADESKEPRLLTLDVIAVDNHGQPVNDLTTDDFQVTDANKAEKIAFFHHRDATLWQVPRLAENEFSNRGGSAITHATVILFDLLNESFSTRTAADQINKCLESREAADDVYLYLLTVEGRLFGVHGLPGAEERPEPDAAPWNKKIKPLMDRAMRDVLHVRPLEIDVAIRVQLTFAALDALGVQLARVPGRKNVVWVTDGVPITLGAARSDIGEAIDYTPELRRLSESLARSGIALYPVGQLLIGTPDRIGGGVFDEPGPASSPGSGRSQVGAATANVGAGTQSLNTLNTLAELTGGRPSTGKDICAALKQARSDDRVGYQIGYDPPESNWDGKYHKLRVTCKRKGVRIQAKAGYFAWVDDPGAGSEQAIRSLSTTEFDAAEIGLRGFLQATKLTARIDARDIALAQDGDHFGGQLRLAIVGYRADGRPESSKTIPLDLHYSAEERDKVLREGITFSGDLPTAGLIKVRLIVYDRGSNAIGSLTIPVNP